MTRQLQCIKAKCKWVHFLSQQQQQWNKQLRHTNAERQRTYCIDARPHSLSTRKLPCCGFSRRNKQNCSRKYSAASEWVVCWLHLVDRLKSKWTPNELSSSQCATTLAAATHSPKLHRIPFATTVMRQYSHIECAEWQAANVIWWHKRHISRANGDRTLVVGEVSAQLTDNLQRLHMQLPHANARTFIVTSMPTRLLQYLLIAYHLAASCKALAAAACGRSAERLNPFAAFAVLLDSLVLLCNLFAHSEIQFISFFFASYRCHTQLSPQLL